VCDLETTKIVVNEEAKAHYRAIAPREKKRTYLYKVKHNGIAPITFKALV
jgi:hypothetical protein